MLDLNTIDDALLVKAYTRLLIRSESQLARLMGKISIDSATDGTLGAIAQKIRQWCSDAKAEVTTFSLEENVLDQCSSPYSQIDLGDSEDTPSVLVQKFFQALQIVKDWC
jgi:hypothetical protein